MTALDEIRSTLLAAVSSALATPTATELAHRATDARDSVLQFQEAVLAALNLPTATELGLLHGRLRSMSQRLEDIEDRLDELSGQVRTLTAALRENSTRPGAHAGRPES